MRMIALVAIGFILGILVAFELAPRAANAPAATAGVRSISAQQIAKSAIPVADVPPASTRTGQTALSEAPGRSEATTDLEVSGRTRCLLARRGIIAAAIVRPVVEVLVSPGDRVTKGQALIKLYDLEVQAKVRARESELRSAEAKAQASRRNLDLAEKSHQTGALPQTTYNEMVGAAQSNEAMVHAAEAELAHAQSELKLYTVTASLDGEVAWLDVNPGAVTWPGTLIWGEILDLRELDVRCELTPAHAAQVALGQSADVWLDGKAEAVATGKVVFIGNVADRNSGLIPLTIRVANAQERWRAEVAVKVRFQSSMAK
jgi:RND family efflux transporter MFP subunit